MAGMSEGIIAGYDGSLGSDEALRWAAREAAARDTALTICHAWAPESWPSSATRPSANWSGSTARRSSPGESGTPAPSWTTSIRR